MSVYFMDGATFLKYYVTEDPGIIKDTSIVLVSSHINKRRNAKNAHKVIIANSLLFPDHDLLFDYTDFKNKEYCESYKARLNEKGVLGFLATVLVYAIDNPRKPIVFLCSKKEKRFRYLKLIQEYVEDTFGYHIFDYKKYKKGKDKTVNKKLDKVYSKCIKIIENLEKQKNRMKVGDDLRYMKKIIMSTNEMGY